MGLPLAKYFKNRKLTKFLSLPPSNFCLLFFTLQHHQVVVLFMLFHELIVFINPRRVGLIRATWPQLKHSAFASLFIVLTFPVLNPSLCFNLSVR